MSNAESGSEATKDTRLITKQVIVTEYLTEDGDKGYDVGLSEDLEVWEVKALLQHGIDMFNAQILVTLMRNALGHGSDEDDDG